MAKVFVSHANTDRAVTNRIVAFLESQGIRCWVAPRDVRAGIDYGEAVMEAIAQCEAMLLVLSAASNESNFVSREVERAVAKEKPVLPVRVENVLPAGALEFYVSSSQWVDAFEEPIEARLAPVLASLGNGVSVPPVSRPPQPPSTPAPGSGAKRYARIGAIALGVIALSVGVIKVAIPDKKPPSPETSAPPPAPTQVTTATPAPVETAPPKETASSDKTRPNAEIDDTRKSAAVGEIKPVPGAASAGKVAFDPGVMRLDPARLSELVRATQYAPFTQNKWCTVVKTSMYQYRLVKGDVLTQLRSSKASAETKAAITPPPLTDFRVTKQKDGTFLMRPLGAKDDANDEIATFDKDVTTMRVTDRAGKQLSNRTVCGKAE